MIKRFSRGAVLAGAAAALLLLAGAAPAQAGSVKVKRTIPFSEGSGASDAVKSECQLETKVPAFLAQFSKSVELVDGSLGSAGRVLELSISEVHAPGGGAFSGAKSMSVTGTLRQDGKKIGSFTARRYSGGGVFGGYKGTCGIVGRCAKAIGKDISRWLENPQMDSKLGDA